MNIYFRSTILQYQNSNFFTSVTVLNFIVTRKYTEMHISHTEVHKDTCA